MALRDYLAGEIANDTVDGLIGRREALRRLGLLGVGLATATSLLAACSDDGNEAAGTTTTATTPPTAPLGSRRSDTITFDGPKGRLTAAWAEATVQNGAVLVIHENRGLTTHFHDLVARLAADGYSALCVDLATATGGAPTDEADPSAAQIALGTADEADLVAALKAGIDELTHLTGEDRVGVVGFCFGGGMTWLLLQDGDPRIAAAAPFYGPAPADPDFSKSTAEVYAVYGELDARVNATRDSAVAALEAAHLDYGVEVFPGADHAFFNDTGPRYDAAAAKQAYSSLRMLFGRRLLLRQGH